MNWLIDFGYQTQHIIGEQYDLVYQLTFTLTF